MIQHSFRWEIVTDDNKPVEVNDSVFIVEDITKSINSVKLSRNSAVCFAHSTNHTF